MIPLDPDVDVVLMLDGCYSYLSTRSPNGLHRRVDVLCAGDRTDPIANGSIGANSFTKKVFVEVRKRAQQGKVDVELSSLIAHLRATASPRKMPTYAAKLGPGSIVLPIIRPPPKSSIIDQSSSIFYPPGNLATFSLHISDNMTREDVNKILQLTHKSPTEASTLRLESVKKTNSTVLIMECAIDCFYRIAGIPGIVLICENFE